jgi:hypothetical protein
MDNNKGNSLADSFILFSLPGISGLAGYKMTAIQQNSRIVADEHKSPHHLTTTQNSTLYS